MPLAMSSRHTSTRAILSVFPFNDYSPPFAGSYGRGAGVGRGRGVGLHLPVQGVGVGVGVGVAVAVAVAVGVGVGVAPDWPQYLPPLLKKFPDSSLPPQTIISLPLHTAV